MSKPVIAVDIDDVLAAEAEAVISYTNTHWGGDFTLDDYTEDWLFWGVDEDEYNRRADELNGPGFQETYQVIAGSVDALKALREKFDLVVLTSRLKKSERETKAWLDENYPELFSNIAFTGFWDDKAVKDRHLLSKGALLHEMGVQYLIDDQPKHCISAAKHGITAVLFGDYGHSRGLEVSENVVRCKDWQEVKEYFGVS